MTKIRAFLTTFTSVQIYDVCCLSFAIDGYVPLQHQTSLVHSVSDGGHTGELDMSMGRGTASVIDSRDRICSYDLYVRVHWGIHLSKIQARGAQMTSLSFGLG